jgi:hypothetical protein
VIVVYDNSISLKYYLPETGLKYTPVYAYSMHVVCTMYALCVLMQTGCTLL